MILARRLAFSIFIGLASMSRLAAQDVPATGEGLATERVDPGAGQTLTITGELQQSDAERRAEAARYFGSHAAPTRIGQFARWNHRIYVRTWGLPLALNAQVSNRVMDVMERFGIPTNRAALCRPNVRIGFTPAPQVMIERAVARNRMIIGFHYASQREQITRIRQPVQAWYATTTIGAAGIEVLDD